MVTNADLLNALSEQRIVAIIRGSEPAAVISSGLTLIECGVTCLEVSLTSTDALGAISEIVRQVGDAAMVGVGTVLSAEDALRARDAGARFAVTPGLGAGVEGALAADLPVLGGALTPTEVIEASRQCAAVKLFPASIGGPSYLRALRSPFPQVPFVPVGGIDADAACEYLAAGALAVGVGSPLLGDAPDGGSTADLRQRARELLDRIR